MTAVEQNEEKRLRLAISVGEYSGDQHAARVITALRQELLKVSPESSLEVRGMGGACLRAAGVDTIIDSETSGAINGFNLPLILKKTTGVFISFVRLLYTWRPDVLVLVDYPDFNLRLATFAKFLNIPVVYFIPPKVWAWRSGRVRAFRKKVDRTACIFPFEKKFFEDHRYKRAEFIGHPFFEVFPTPNHLQPEGEAVRKELGISDDTPLIAVLPGSRQSELDRHLPVVCSTIEILRKERAQVEAIIALPPTIDIASIRQQYGNIDGIHITQGNANEVMSAADCGLLKSGTCNLEAAFLDLPFVCFYKTSRVSELLVRTLVSIKEFSLVNILRSGCVKEFMQEEATAEKLSQELSLLLFDDEYRRKQQSRLQEVRQSLQTPEHVTDDAEHSASVATAQLILETAERRSSPVAVFKRMYQYLQPYKKHFLAALGCMVLFGASDGAVPFLVKHILDGIFANQDRSMLTLLPILLVLFTIVRAAADFGQEYLMSRVGHNIVRDIRAAIHAHLLNLSSDFYIRNSSGSILSRFTSDVILVRTLLTNSLASIIRDSIRIVALLVTAFYLDPFLALLAFVFFPLGLYPVYRFGKRMRGLSRKGQLAIGSLSALIQEIIVGNKVVKIFCREDFERSRFGKENERLNETFIKGDRVRALSGPVNEILGSLAISGVILYGGLTVMNGVRSQGEFIAFLLSVFLLYDPFKKLSRVNSAVQQGASGAERIFELLDTPVSIASPSNPTQLQSGNTIEFREVGFRYKAESDLVLDAISLKVPEGKTLALVGHSGAGKSTLVDLIPRFIEAQTGSVSIGDVDVTTVPLSELRARITMVSQHTFLFNDTIFNNIAYGKKNATKDEVLAAATAAHAIRFIEELPLGFDTIIGEDGLSLSGGERQRISIARALLKNSPILILDEATASLDNRSEREVQAALDGLLQNRTTIVIAHRLSTIRNADNIVVLDAGKIIEMGTHQELLAKGGAFARLHALQFAGQETENAPVESMTVAN